MATKKQPSRVVAVRDVHVAGVGACAQGAVLDAGEPLVAAQPDAFRPER